MKLAFLVDPPGGLNPKKDSSIAMMREASRRGHEVYAFGLPDLRVEEGAVLERARALAIDGDNAAWFRDRGDEEAPL